MPTADDYLDGFTLIAGADLLPFRMIKVNGSAQAVYTTTGDRIDGRVAGQVTSGQPARVQTLGKIDRARAVAGGTIAVSDLLTTSTNGTLITSAGGTTPPIVGRSFMAAASGDLFEFIPYVH